jgi:hypothetical protein
MIPNPWGLIMQVSVVMTGLLQEPAGSFNGNHRALVESSLQGSKPLAEPDPDQRNAD